MPDSNVIIVRPDLTDREPAHWEYLDRKFLATGRKGERWRVIEHCRAELTWSRLGWIGGSDGYYDGPHMSETCRLPHEHAAARVLNAWNHLHPTEWRIRENLTVLRSQFNAGLTSNADATRAYLRLVWGDRARQATAFFAAVNEYRWLRAKLDTQDAA